MTSSPPPEGPSVPPTSDTPSDQTSAEVTEGVQDHTPSPAEGAPRDDVAPSSAPDVEEAPNVDESPDVTSVNAQESTETVERKNFWRRPEDGAPDHEGESQSNEGGTDDAPGHADELQELPESPHEADDVDEDTAPMEAYREEDTEGLVDDESGEQTAPLDDVEEQAAPADDVALTDDGMIASSEEANAEVLEDATEPLLTPAAFVPRGTEGPDLAQTAPDFERPLLDPSVYETSHPTDHDPAAPGSVAAEEFDVAAEPVTTKWRRESRDLDTAELAAQEGGYEVQYFDEPTPRRNAFSKKLLIGILAALCLVGGAIAAVLVLANPSGPKAGDCITLQGTASNLKTSAAECTDTSKVVYKVAKSGSGKVTCPGDAYTKYTIPDRNDPSKAEQYSCLVPLLNADQCYGGDALAPFDCNDGKAKLRITKRLNSLDPQACQGLGSTVSYPEPAPGLTYCVAPPK